MVLIAGTKLRPYEIQSPLGSGGMGEVYRAIQSSLGRQVAIKVLPAEKVADPERKQRFVYAENPGQPINRLRLCHSRSSQHPGIGLAFHFLQHDLESGHKLQPCLVTGWRLYRFLAGVVTRPDRDRDRAPERGIGANSERDQRINAADFQRPVNAHIAVSPDGRTILYPQSDESGSVLMLVDNFR